MLQPNEALTTDADLRGRRLRRVTWLLLGVSVVGVVIWLFRNGTSLTTGELLEQLQLYAAHPLAPIAATAIFTLAAILATPLSWLVALSALTLEPVVATTVSLLGTIGSTVVTHQIGWRFAEPLSARLPDAMLARIKKLAAGADTIAMLGLRMVPVAPFAIVNAAVGVAGVPLKPLLYGTILAVTPGIVLLSFSIDRARAALRGEPLFDPWVAALIVLGGIGLMALRYWRARTPKDEESAAPHASASDQP